MNLLRKSFIRELVLGLMISLLFIQSAPPAQAQFEVVDHTAWSQRLQEYLKEADRWMERVHHWEDEFNRWQQEYTTMNGILGKAEKLVARNTAIFKTFASLGQSVRAIFTLKNQIEALVVRNIQSIKNIDDRLRAGIFNPQADLADLEDYLKNSIGRASQDRAATLERIANMDTLLQRWYEELQMARARKASIVKQREAILPKILDEEFKDEGEGCATCIESLKAEMRWCDEQIIKLDEQISDLMNKIEERMKKWNVEMRERGDTARDIEEVEESWDKFFSVKEEVLYELDNYSGSKREGNHPTE